jgi:protein SCO1
MKHVVLSLLAVLALTQVCRAQDDADLSAGVFSPPRSAPDFSLNGSDGEELTLGRYRGKVVLLAFGFTNCADTCPVTLAVLAQARQELGAAGDGVQVLYITVDPERDDAERMRNYLAGFDATFIGGTGSDDRLAAVRDEYGVFATKNDDKDKEMDGSMSHSSYVYLIDRSGMLRALMPFGRETDDFVHDIRMLLHEAEVG